MDNLEGRIRGLLKLVRPWLENPNWYKPVIAWMKTPQGANYLEKEFAIVTTTHFLGITTVGAIPAVVEGTYEEQVAKVCGKYKRTLPAVTEETYMEQVLQLWEEEGGERGQTLEGQLREQLRTAIAEGYVLSEGGKIRLSESGIWRYVLTLRIEATTPPKQGR